MKKLKFLIEKVCMLGPFRHHHPVEVNSVYKFRLGLLAAKSDTMRGIIIMAGVMCIAGLFLLACLAPSGGGFEEDKPKGDNSKEI